MFLTTLQRTILRELVQVFLTALLVCIGILIVADMFDDRWQNCADATAVLCVIQWLILAMLPEAVPTALLFATCQVYGRMRRDMEWQAVQAGGIHFSHVVMPAFALAAFLSGIILAISYTALPSAEFMARKAVIKQGEALLYAKIRSSGFVTVPPYTIYARRVNGTELVDPILKRATSNGQHDLVMQAQTGRLSIDAAFGVLRMESVAVLENEKKVGGHVEDFKWDIPLPDCFGVYYPQTAREMTLSAVMARRDLLLKEEAALDSDPTLTPEQSAEKHRALRREIRWLDVEVQKRPALAVGCLCFALVGCGAGIYAGFGDILSAFVACFLPICATHYILLICGMQWAVKYDCPPELTIWLANAAVGTAGFALFWHATRRWAAPMEMGMASDTRKAAPATFITLPPQYPQREAADAPHPIVGYGTALAACLVILGAVLTPWKCDLRVPFYYQGDALAQVALIKGMLENGWYLENPQLGAPFHQDLHDYPMADGMHWGWLKLFSCFSAEPGVVFNLYYLVSFPLTTILALAVLRRFSISFPVGTFAALLYTFLPWHFLRMEHLFLACYYMVPPTIMVAVEIYLGRLTGEPDQGTRGGWLNRRTIRAAAISLLVGVAGIYYAFFAGMLMLVAGLAHSCKTGSGDRCAPRSPWSF